MGNITDYLLVFGFAFWRFVPGTYLLYRAMMSDKVSFYRRLYNGCTVIDNMCLKYLRKYSMSCFLNCENFY